MRVVLACLFVFFASCTKTEVARDESVQTPEDVVRAFVELSSSAQDFKDRNKLRSFVSGELKRAFTRMPDEVFQISYLNSKLKIKDLKISKAKREGDSALVVYTVLVENNQGADPTEETNQREVELTRQNDTWYIESIRTMGTDKIAFTRGMIF